MVARGAPQARQTRARPYGWPLLGEMVRLIASTSAVPRAPALQAGDLLLQQLVLEQHLAEPRLQPLALQRLAIRGPARQCGFASSEERITPCGQRRGGNAERARHRLQILPAQQTQHRVPLALS